MRLGNFVWRSSSMVNLIARCWCLSDTLLPEEIDTAPVEINRAAKQKHRTALDVAIFDMQARNTVKTPRGVQTFIIRDILWHTVPIQILPLSSDKY
jgi:hypothetical protein